MQDKDKICLLLLQINRPHYCWSICRPKLIHNCHSCTNASTKFVFHSYSRYNHNIMVIYTQTKRTLIIFNKPLLLPATWSYSTHKTINYTLPKNRTDSNTACGVARKCFRPQIVQLIWTLSYMLSLCNHNTMSNNKNNKEGAYTLVNSDDHCRISNDVASKPDKSFRV